MRIISTSLCLIALIAASVSLTGCDSHSTDNRAESQKCEAGCTSHDHGASQDPTEGPHGGDLIELGNEEYHAELLIDEKTKTVTIHLLDSPAEKPVAIESPEITLQLLREGKFVKYSLKAVETKDVSKKGTASEFKIVGGGLSDAICQDKKTQGRLQLTINGKPYTGTVKLRAYPKASLLPGDVGEG
jgi:hypothetical protein